MKLIRKFLKGVIIQSLLTLGHDFDSTSLEGALARCRNHGLNIRTVIDIGASNGSWSVRCQKYFPDAFYFLVEAQKPHEADLKRFKARHPNVDYILAAAGDTEGKIYFDDSHLQGGIASHSPFEKDCIVVPVTTIDRQVNVKNLTPPFLIKLDTHGFEVPIITGAKDTLKQTELIVMEVYNFNFTPGQKRFHQICHFMEAQGFRCLDICDPLHRPRDKALWQFDMFFASANNPIFASNDYH